MQIVQKNAEPFFYPGGKTGILLVHGFTGSPSEMRPLGQFLAAKGYTVQGVRLAGHGTNLDDMVGTTWGDWYDSVRSAYRELEEKCSRVFIVGLSMGGILSLHASLEFSPVAVISINAPIRLVNRRAIFAPLLRHLRLYAEKANPSAYPDHFSYSRMPLNSLNSLLQLIRLVRRELPRVTSPLLVLQSERDDVVNPASAKLIFNNSGSLEKEIEWFPKSGHLLTLGSERDTVFKRVLEFIERQD